MAYVYILRGSSGRHYIGSTENLERRISEHLRGAVHTTARLGNNLQLICHKELSSTQEARLLERKLKRLKNPKLAIASLNQML